MPYAAKQRPLFRTGRAVALALVATALGLAGCGGGGGGSSSSGGGTPPPAATVTVVAAGDIAECGNAPPSAAGAAKTAPLIAPTDALILTLGDTTYPVGALSEFTDCFHPNWGAFKSRIRPAPGNHEYLTPNADGYYTYFGTQAGPDRRGYYSYDFGGWHFISLNSNIDASPGSPQYQWLQADLASSRAAACTIAYWHFPVFSSSEHGNIDVMAQVFAALQLAGVDIVLNGHDHVYERFAPQTAAGAVSTAHGIRQFTVGTGGVHLYQFLGTKPNSEFRYNANHGILRLTLGANDYAWQFVAVDGGTVIDAGRDTCHP